MSEREQNPPTHERAGGDEPEQSRSVSDSAGGNEPEQASPASDSTGEDEREQNSPSAGEDAAGDERTQQPPAGTGAKPGRLAAQLAAKKAADARRRRLSILGRVAGVVVVGSLIGTLVVTNNDKDDKDPAASSATTTPIPEPSVPPTPPLPSGTDPALATKPVVTAGKGELKKLTVKTLIKGKGPAVKSGQTITTNYVGVFYNDGKEFDASWSRGGPATFTIGVGEVIKGWDQGLIGVTVGSRVQLDIPAELGSPSLGGPLRFVVDVLAAR